MVEAIFKILILKVVQLIFGTSLKDQSLKINLKKVVNKDHGP